MKYFKTSSGYIRIDAIDVFKFIESKIPDIPSYFNLHIGSSTFRITLPEIEDNLGEFDNNKEIKEEFIRFMDMVATSPV